MANFARTPRVAGRNHNMNRGFKLGAYVALLVFGLFSGYRLKQVFTGNSAPAATKATVKKIQPPAVTNAVPLTNSTPSSNVAAVFTNILGLAQAATNRISTNQWPSWLNTQHNATRTIEVQRHQLCTEGHRFGKSSRSCIANLIVFGRMSE